jgi:sec-independent protein translocase protein TatC
VSQGDHPEADVEMTFFDHLAELRSRLIRALLGLIPCVVIAWTFKELLLGEAFAPLISAFERHGLPSEIHFSNPAAKVMAFVKVSVIAGLLLGSPWIFWQVWAFISPGLYRREKLMAIPFVVASTVCFAGGALFGHFLVFPMIFDTLINFGGEVPGVFLKPTLMVDEVITFVVRLLLAFGAVFEVPVVVVFLAVAGIVDWKQLLSFGRYWAVVAAILAALLTPPDVVSQMMMLGPMIGLYYLAVLLAYLFTWGREKAEDDEGTVYER